MNLFICGSRTIEDKKWIFSKIEECIAENHFTNITVFNDNLKGVDAIAREWAIEHGVPVIEFPPDYEKYKHDACYKRNEAMVIECDFMLDLWTGESTGSLHDIIMAEKYHKPYEVYIYNTSKFAHAAEFVIGCDKEIFHNSVSLKEVLRLFKNAVYKEIMSSSVAFPPSWINGHNPSSYFWIRPVNQGKNVFDGDGGCYYCYDEEISIEEEVVSDFLYYQFLKPHFDTFIKYSCRESDESGFDWWGHNLYTYESVRKMAEEMKIFAKENSFGDAVSKFYITLADRLLLMMEQNPDWDFITFEGP